MNSDELPATVRRLFGVLRERGVRHVLVGGLAMLRYVSGRNTEDVDVIMAASSLKRTPEIIVHSQDRDFARCSYEHLRIDVLLTTNRLFRHVQDQHVSVERLEDVEVPCATIEGLMLLKLYALPSLYRQGDLIRAATYELDILSLIHTHDPDLVPLLAELSHHVSATDLDAIRDVLADIRRRLDRR